MPKLAAPARPDGSGFSVALAWTRSPPPEHDIDTAQLVDGQSVLAGPPTPPVVARPPTPTPP